MFWIIILAVVVGFILIVNNTTTTLSRWQATFPNFNYSAEEFYGKTQEVLTQLNISGMDFSRITFSQTGVLSANREYLRIKRNEYVFYVCAAPFAGGFFVSWWLVERPGFIKTITRDISWLRWLGNILDSKTYYQVDTEGMYKGCVSSVIQGVVEQITSGKTIRGLKELDWKAVDNPRLKW